MSATHHFSFLNETNIPALQSILRSFFILSILLSYTTSSAQILNINKVRCKLSKEDTDNIIRIARYEAAFYNAVFETSKNDSLAINLHIFGRKADFRETPDGENVLHVSSDGYFMENSGDVFVLKTDHVSNVLLHEISHAFLHHNIKNPPKWFDEGLATYFGSLTVQDKQIFYVPIMGRIERISALKDSKLLHLHNFLNSKNSNWGNKQDVITDQYTIAYSIIYFLIKTNLNLIKHLATELENDKPSTTIMADIFGSFDNFENRYHSFYKNQNN